MPDPVPTQDEFAHSHAIPIPIGLYSFLSVTTMRIKLEGKRWRSVQAMAWRPEELAEFLRSLHGKKSGV